MVMSRVKIDHLQSVVPVFCLTGGLVYRSRNQSQNHSPVAIEGDPHAILHIVGIYLSADLTPVAVGRIQIKNQPAAIVITKIVVPPSAQLGGRIAEGGQKVIYVLLHRQNRLTVAGQLYQFTEPVVYIVHSWFLFLCTAFTANTPPFLLHPWSPADAPDCGQRRHRIPPPSACIRCRSIPGEAFPAGSKPWPRCRQK